MGLLSTVTAVVASLPAPVTPPVLPVERQSEPVVLAGAQMAGWAVPSETTLRLPLMDLVPDEDPHSDYAEPDASTAPLIPAGAPVDRLAGFRWDGSAYVAIPFQVDERFTRYLNNSASGFAIYSGEDRHLTYAYDKPGDREGFRYRNDGPAEDPCRARPASPAASDPVAGLDADDELVFMASDAGARAPLTAPKPTGVGELREVAVTDPVAGTVRYAYVGLLRAGAARPATGSYVRYARDADADLFAFSESSYGDYGAAPEGLYCDADGNVVRNPDGSPKTGQRRPRDGATISTSRYRFRYDGRWLMSAINVSPDGGRTYGPDLVDRWKARAFAQDPGSETPCCGYEEEDTNWGGSSILLGEHVGPVRAVRETWGADSGTNVIRRETFYRDEMVQRTWLRVHVIPPLDGIYAQWDFNAGVMDRFFNQRRPEGVPVDGVNDEALGNLDDPCNPGYDQNTTSATDQGYRALYATFGLCELPYHQSIDLFDPLFSDLNAGLGWAVTAGPHGSVVDRLQMVPEDTTLGGQAQSVLAVPYYRDDSCFDDGTGTDPGPKLHLRSADEPQTYDGAPRRCWKPSDGVAGGDPRFFQGSIGTHGMHLLAVAESDNARLTVPVTEITADWRMVMLPGRHDARAGVAHGRRFERPLLTAVLPR